MTGSRSTQAATSAARSTPRQKALRLPDRREGSKAQCQTDGCGTVFDSIDYIAKTRGCDRDAAIKLLSGYEPMKPHPRPEDQDPGVPLRTDPGRQDPAGWSGLQVPLQGQAVIAKYSPSWAYGSTGTPREQPRPSSCARRIETTGRRTSARSPGTPSRTRSGAARSPSPPLYGADQLAHHRQR